MKLVGKGIPRPAAAIAARAAALDHEVRDHAMEGQPVVIILLLLLSRFLVNEFLGALRQADEIGDGLRRFLFEQTDDDAALRRFKDGVGSCASRHETSCGSIHRTRGSGSAPI